MLSDDEARKRGLGFYRGFLIWMVPALCLELGILYWFFH